MGDTAAATAEESTVEIQTDEEHEPAPFNFNVGDDEPSDGKPEDEKPPAKTEEHDADLKKKVEELEAENKKKQAIINKGFYDARQKRKQEKAEKGGDETKPSFTDAQLLKILEEHQGEPAVLLQVMKHMSEAQAEKVEKKAVDSTEIRQHQEQTDSWLRKNVPDLYDETSERRTQTDEIKGKLRLNDHPLGDFLATAAAMLAQMPQAIQQAREDERKKALGDKAETVRKKDVKDAAPAGGKTSKTAASAVSDSEYTKQGKAMGLSASALKLYVEMRRKADKPSREVMEA